MQRIAAEDAKLREHKVGLDAHEEELVAREEVLAAKLHDKDDEVQTLLADWTQELEWKHKEAIEAQATDHADKIKEAIYAAEAAEAAKNELDGKVKKLEADIIANNEEILKFKVDIQKTTHTLVELQVSLSAKNQELTKEYDRHC